MIPQPLCAAPPFSALKGAAIIGAHKKAPSCEPGALVCTCGRCGDTRRNELPLTTPRRVRTDEFI